MILHAADIATTHLITWADQHLAARSRRRWGR